MRVTSEDVERFISEKRESTQKSYGYILKGFLKEYGGELSEDSVRSFVNAYGDKLSSRRTALQILKSFAKWRGHRIPPSEARKDPDTRWMLLERIPEISIESPVEKVEKKGIGMEELKGILGRLDGLPFSGIWCLFYFGCRPGELVALEPHMIGDGKVAFTTGKTYVERPIPFSDFTGEHLEEFVNSGFGYQYLYKRCKEVGIVPKDGRRSFRTQMDHRLAELGVRPVRGDLLIKLAQGHTVSKDMAGVYGSYEEDLEKLFLDWHYLLPLEEKLQE